MRSPLQIAVDHLTESAAVKQRLAASEIMIAVVQSAQKIAERVLSGGKIMFCGNGGSAADSQHLAAELTNRLRPEFQRPGIPAIALTTDTSYLTARANDSGFEGVFERLIATLGKPDDALVLISTSGNSPGIIRAADCARKMGILTVGFLGGSGGALAVSVDIPIIVPSGSVQHIQEAHIAVGHIICQLVEEALYGQPQTTLPHKTEIACVSQSRV